VTETDPYGNLLATRRRALLRKDASSGQRTEVLSDALGAAVEWAKKARNPSLPRILTSPQRRSSWHSPVRSRHGCSADCSMRIIGISLGVKCFRTGVELIKSNPAYTSTIGAVKYASRRGWSVHAPAAGVIARRGQKLTERAPRCRRGYPCYGARWPSRPHATCKETRRFARGDTAHRSCSVQRCGARAVARPVRLAAPECERHAWSWRSRRSPQRGQPFTQRKQSASLDLCNLK